MSALEYYLRESPHKIVRQIAPVIEESFPNLEIFWSKYLMPLTGNQSNPSSPDWRIDTLPNLEEIGMATFGILKSLNFINISIEDIDATDSKQTFKNIYFHFGLLFDSVEDLLRNIVIIKYNLGIIDLRRKGIISKEKLMESYEKWIDNLYHKKYEQMIEVGKPIFYYPQHDNNFIKILIKDKNKRRNYWILIETIKKYRNFYIHTPGVGISKIDGTNELRVLKREEIYRCRRWSEYKKLDRNNKEYFGNPEIIVQNDMDEVLKTLNDLWIDINNEMDEIYNHNKFNTIFKNYQRN